MPRGVVSNVTRLACGAGGSFAWNEGHYLVRLEAYRGHYPGPDVSAAPPLSAAPEFLSDSEVNAFHRYVVNDLSFLSRRSTRADSTDATIFSFFLSDIVDLPFDSNSTKVGVSPYIGTRGFDTLCAERDRSNSPVG